MRRPAGSVKIWTSTGYRVCPFVMGGSVRVGHGEWVESVAVARPVLISARGLPVAMIPIAPLVMVFGAGEIARDLRFNRLPLRKETDHG